MMNCKNCDSSLPTKAKFCQECGAPTNLSTETNRPDQHFDDSIIDGVKILIKRLKKFNKDIDPREHNDLLSMVVELDVLVRMTEVVEAIEVIKDIQDDDEKIAALLAAFPDLDREFRIYNQTVKVVLSYLNDQNLDD